MPGTPDDVTLDEPTCTEALELGRDRAREAFGILWLTPEERFHELVPNVTIGRAPECELCLEGPSVSRRHARIEKGGPLWMLRDLESKNGIYINAQRRELTPIAPQDTLRIGEWVGVACVLPRTAVDSGRYFEELSPGICVSAATLARLGQFRSLARGQVPLIIVGETGTGKEVLARTLHSESGRTGPLIAVNCAAIPEGLAEAELFGHNKGAFTGAVRNALGHIAAAHQGTLLLDEVIELSPAIQSKLLRAIEERAVTPLGTTQPMATDFRLIAASQVPLAELVEAGEFRGDLYARLNGATLELPALRQRREEVLRLLVGCMQRELGQAPRFDRRCAERLCAHDWPYNVRELVQLARLLASNPRPEYEIEDLPAPLRDPPPPSSEAQGPGKVSPRRQSWLMRNASELERLKAALEACEGNVYRAALTAGIPRHRARRLLAAEAELEKARGSST